MKEGQLQVWWIPQVPMKPFIVDVSTVSEAALLLNTLANYDLFQLEHNVKPDYSNAGGLNIWEGGEWISWMDYETGIEDPIEYIEYIKSNTEN